MNTLIFAIAFLIVAIVMLTLFNNVTTSISYVYAQQYAKSTAAALSARIDRDVAVISRLANSEAVVEWMRYENDRELKARAYSEMESVINELYSLNLYVGFKSTLNEYLVESGSQGADAEPIDILDINREKDAWFFNSVNSGREYVMEIGIDMFVAQKRVFIYYRVVDQGAVLGVISTGLEFSHMVGELFSHYDSDHMRGLIMDSRGVIHMDSSLMGDSDFLHSDFAENINDWFPDSQIKEALEEYLDSAGEYHKGAEAPEAVQLRSEVYQLLSIAPVESTNWTVIVLSGGESLFNILYFMPLLATMLILLLVVAIVTSVANYSLIFSPLGKLGRSIAALRENTDGHVFGTERNDELGELATTIQDMFKIANVDALTGLYNRRFMENNIELIMGMQSRNKGLLSVFMIDIDNFKKYNDTYGHEQGDVCLRAVAKALASNVQRSSDFAARYGGEEFVIFLADSDEQGSRLIAEKILDSVRTLEIPHSGNDAAPYVTVSVGVATGRVEYWQKWEDYVKIADDALYVSKQSGRNRYTFSEKTITENPEA